MIYKAGENLEITLSIHPDSFLRLTRAIVGQQLSVKAAGTIFGRFEKLFQNGINPKELLKLKAQDIRTAGISFKKISYLHDLAEKTLTKEVLLNDFNHKPDEKVIEDLVKIKGIGRWTAEMFLIFSLGRPDVFSNGDLGLQNAIQKMYKLGTKPSLEYLEKLSFKWSPFRTYASMILWRSLDNEPK